MRKGTTYYDVTNDRYITVHFVDEASRTASCDVFEANDYGEYKIRYMQHFTFVELCKFMEVKL